MTYLNTKDTIEEILISEKEIDNKLSELAQVIDNEYGKDDDTLLLIGVLKGATYVMTDFSRKLTIDTQMDWMSLSSYGSGTHSSGVVRVLKDLDVDVKGRNILIVEDIIDSGLTLTWLIQNLKNRGAKSVEVVALLEKQIEDETALQNRIKAKWVGFQIPDKFVVGYGLDYAEHFRTLPYIGVLKPSVYLNNSH
ncbi:MAG: hypoxanthine phosphoribosyltransferase [Candidatus Ancillula sp.]|jgi:hypoxanthine phosphoribosyltransferase|nr:hypoxanthine phosphoribosyltransferase [Candidatus Ancillula sp.]